MKRQQFAAYLITVMYENPAHDRTETVGKDCINPAESESEAYRCFQEFKENTPQDVRRVVLTFFDGTTAAALSVFDAEGMK